MTPHEQFMVSVELGRLGVPDDLTAEESAVVIARLAATMRCILIDFGGEPGVAQQIAATAAQNAVRSARPRKSPVLRVV